jgi:signal transduction histidine kinase
MSAEIEQSDRQRKRMTADIAHDLRTPLTVIGGYIESMRDGDLEPTPERLAMLYSEITRLNRMVSDLRLLSQSDAGALSLNLQLSTQTSCWNAPLNCLNCVPANSVSI